MRTGRLKKEKLMIYFSCLLPEALFDAALKEKDEVQKVQPSFHHSIEYHS
jgi:hypothetical protein